MPVTAKPKREKAITSDSAVIKPRSMPKAAVVPPILPTSIVWWKTRWFACLALLLVTAAVYSPVRHYPFTDYDDDGYVAKNKHVQDGLTRDTLVWSFTTTEQANWHPLTWLSHALDCEMFGPNPGPHHITSVAFHITNAVLLFLLLDAITGFRARSLLVAALFALHPFNVDSVVWIAERKNVLSTFFFFLSLGAYGWYARKPNWQRYLLMFLMFVASLLAKPMMVTFPFVLLLLDFWPMRRVKNWISPSTDNPVPQFSAGRLLLEKLPLMVISAASSVVTMIAQQGVIQPLQVLSWEPRLENVIASYALYLGKAFWPFGFAVHYPNLFDPLPGNVVSGKGWLAFLAGMLLLVGVTTLVCRQHRTRPQLPVAWFWYLGTLVPVIGIIQVGIQGMADRYAYVPLIGVFVIAVWCAAELANALNLSVRWRITSATLILGILVFLTVRQVGYWRSSFDLWTHAMAVTENNIRAIDHVGAQLVQLNRGEEGMEYFRRAARLDPNDADSHLVLGAYDQDAGRLHEAIRDYQVVVHGTNDPVAVVSSYVNLTMIFGELGDFGRAHEAFNRAQLKSSELTQDRFTELGDMVAEYASDEGFVRLGILAEQYGNVAGARAAYRRALQMNPQRKDAMALLEHLNTVAVQTPQ